MSKHTVMFARFPFGNQECPDSSDWLVRSILKAKADERIGDILHARIDDTPITMSRNRVVVAAIQRKVDYLVMIDSDMKPDCEPDGKLFWDSSWEFMMQQREPCVIAAPYCGPPPHENVYVFQWGNKMNRAANPDFTLDQFTREHAAQMSGITEVAALPTGLMILDMRAIEKLKPPFFYYEWKDGFETEKASTEDVTFTRDLSMVGVKCFCNWDAWAGHWKRHLVRRPRPLTVNEMSNKFADAIRHNVRSDERIVEVPRGGIRLRKAKATDLAPTPCTVESNGG